MLSALLMAILVVAPAGAAPCTSIAKDATVITSKDAPTTVAVITDPDAPDELVVEIRDALGKFQGEDHQAVFTKDAIRVVADLRAKANAEGDAAEKLKITLQLSGGRMTAAARREMIVELDQHARQAQQLQAEAREIEARRWSKGPILSAQSNGNGLTLLLESGSDTRIKNVAGWKANPTLVATAISALFDELNQPPIALLDIWQDVGTSIRRPVDDNVQDWPTLTGLDDLTVFVDALSSSDAETPADQLTYTWTVDGQPLPIRDGHTEITPDLLLVQGTTTPPAGEHVCLKVAVSDGSKYSEAQVELVLMPRMAMSAITPGVQQLVRPHRDPYFGLRPARMGWEQSWSTLHVGAVPKRPTPATTWRWTAVDGPRLGCDALARAAATVIRCDDQQVFFAETSSPTLALATFRPGRYTLRAQAVTDGLPSDELTLSTEALYTRSSLHAGGEPAYGAGFRWIGSSSIPYASLAVGFRGFRLHGGLGAVAELSQRELTSALLEFGFDLRLAELSSSATSLWHDRTYRSGEVATHTTWDVQVRGYRAFAIVTAGDQGHQNIGSHLGLEVGPTVQRSLTTAGIGLVLAKPLTGDVRTPELGVAIELGYRAENLARGYRPDNQTWEAMSMERIARINRNRCTIHDFRQRIYCGDDEVFYMDPTEKKARHFSHIEPSKYDNPTGQQLKRADPKSKAFKATLLSANDTARLGDPALDLDDALRRTTLEMATQLFPDIPFCLRAPDNDKGFEIPFRLPPPDNDKGFEDAFRVASCDANPYLDALIDVRRKAAQTVAEGATTEVEVQLTCVNCGRRYRDIEHMGKDMLPYLLDARDEALARQASRAAEARASKP